MKAPKAQMHGARTVIVALIGAICGGNTVLLVEHAQDWRAIRDRLNGVAMSSSGSGDEKADSTPIAITHFAPGPLFEDRVSPNDGSIAVDGLPDQRFFAELDGPVAALVLATTDRFGMPDGTCSWDTIVGSDPIPAQARARAFPRVGRTSWQLGVYAAGSGARPQPLNAADGSVHLGDEHHRIEVFASDCGWFGQGNHFRLFAIRPRGNVVASQVIAFSGTAPPTFASRPNRGSIETPNTFNAGEAAASLGLVDLQRCTEIDPMVGGTAALTISFNPEDGASAARVTSGPFAETPKGACIAAEFRKATVSPFVGLPVSVDRRVTLDPAKPATSK